MEPDNRYADLVSFLQSHGWADIMLPAIAERGKLLTKQLIESNGDAVSDALKKGELRALKWVAELPQFRAEQIKRQQAQDQLETRIPPRDSGSPYAPTAEEIQLELLPRAGA